MTRSALRRVRSQPDKAAREIEAACRRVEYEGLTDIAMRVLEELAAVALALSRRQEAADLLATADDARRRYAKPLSPACRVEVDGLRSMVSDQVGTAIGPSQVIAVAHSLASSSTQ